MCGAVLALNPRPASGEHVLCFGVYNFQNFHYNIDTTFPVNETMAW